MRRVLLADDPRLAPRLERLRESMGGTWDLLLTQPDQIDFWRESVLSVHVAAFPEADVQVPAGEAVDLVVAASSPELLKTGSQLAFRSGSQVAVLPAAAQTADWIFSLFPLSEGAVPRVRGVFEHRAAPAVKAFEFQLPEMPAARHLAGGSTVAAATLTREDVEACFIEDVDLFRQLAGEFKELFAVEIPVGESGRSRSLSLMLRGEGAGSISLAIGPGTSTQLGIKQHHGGCVFLIRDERGYRLEGGVLPGTGEFGSPYVPWDCVLRVFDDLAAFRRSLKRRRMVELQTETISERSQFKSLMSASGCGLLVMTLLGAVCLLGAGAAFDPRESLQRTSERSGLILRADDFQSTETELTESAADNWPGMVHRLSHSAAPILVERTDDQPRDDRRRDALIGKLTSAGIPSPASRVELYRFRGDLFLRLLTIAWIVLFLPLGLFLAFQGLLLAAPRPVIEGGNP